MHILVVDDDFVGRTKLIRLLSEYGHCTAVSNGELAVEAVGHAYRRKVPYDLITMDFDMPDMKGPQVVRLIRQHERDNALEIGNQPVKVMMITVMQDSDSIMSSFREGATFYLMKPVNPKNLEQALIQLGFVETPKEQEMAAAAAESQE